MRLQTRWKSLVNPASAHLREFRRNVTSQRGEDGVIDKIMEIIGTTNRYCVEFGAWDGKHYSNTWNLLKNKGWGGLLIEASPDTFLQLQAEYAGHDRVTTLNALVGTEGPEALDAILTASGAPRDLDLLCIDIDGNDFHVWSALAGFMPRLVVIEFNPTVPNDLIFVQDHDPAVNQGASLLAMIELGQSKGYELVATTDWNAFFVPKALFPAFGIGDNDIDAMHDMRHFESRLFQCYDGTLVLSGCKHLLWADIGIGQEDIQVLPASMRKFGGAA